MIHKNFHFSFPNIFLIAPCSTFLTQTCFSFLIFLSFSETTFFPSLNQQNFSLFVCIRSLLLLARKTTRTKTKVSPLFLFERAHCCKFYSAARESARTVNLFILFFSFSHLLSPPMWGKARKQWHENRYMLTKGEQITRWWWLKAWNGNYFAINFRL